MSCNIRIPLQQIIDDVAAALSDGFIKTDNAVLNEAVLNEVTIRGGITVDTDARNALCRVLQTCGIAAAELSWLSRPTAPDTVAVSRTAGGELSVAWESLDNIISWGNIGGDIEDQLDLVGRKIPAEDVVTEADRTQAEKNQDALSVKDFGAKGDGVTDDTLALQEALMSGKALVFPEGVYNHTGLSISTPSINITSHFATFRKIGDHTANAVELKITADSCILGTMTFDANNTAQSSLVITNVQEGGTYEERASIILGEIISCNAYRKTMQLGGDGIMVKGGFKYLKADKIRVHDIYAETDVMVFGSQGIFGFSTGSSLGKYIQHVDITDITVENLWARKGNTTAMGLPAGTGESGVKNPNSDDQGWYVNDQDGIRIFQDSNDKSATCNIGRYTCINVANRAIKFHSAANAVVNNVFRLMDGSVIPIGNSAEFSNPDIDSQQSCVSVGDFRFYYKGACHTSIIRPIYTTTPGRMNVSVVDNISGIIENVPGRDISLIMVSSDTPVSDYRLTVNNINVQGKLATLASLNTKTTDKSAVTLNNVIVDLTDSAIKLLGTNRYAVALTLSNIINLGTPVKLLASTSELLAVKQSNVIGFTSTAGVINTDDTTKSVGINAQPSSQFSVVIGTATPGANKTQIRGSSNLTSTSLETDYTAWTEWYHQGLDKKLGMFGYINGVNNDLEWRNYGTGGGFVFREGDTTVAILRGTTSTFTGSVASKSSMKATSYENSDRVVWKVGAGTPEGVVTAVVGSMYSQTDSATDSPLWVKVSGVASTGWQKTTLV